MKFYSALTFGLLAVTTIVSAQQSNDGKPRMKGDFLDVPVRAGYRIEGNDDDGFLEDGIIVAEKGTGYIDPKYRKRYEQTFDYNVRPSVYEVPAYNHQPRAFYSSQGQQQPQQQVNSAQQYQYQPQASSIYDSYYYPKPLASNQVYSRYAVPEIIYGRRDW